MVFPSRLILTRRDLGSSFLLPKGNFCVYFGFATVAQREKLAMKRYLISAALGLAALFLFAQEHDHGQSQQAPAGQSELNATTEAMWHGHNHEEHQHMAAHMHMTELRPVHAGAALKAPQVVEQARPTLERYPDYKHSL